MEQLTGRGDLYLDGSYVETTQEGSTISNLSGVEQTAVVNSRGGMAGYTAKSVPAQIKVNVPHGPDFDIAKYNGALGMISIDFACDNDVVYQMASAVFVKDDGLDANKGMVPITYTGFVQRI